jgi:hypothetical protein
MMHLMDAITAYLYGILETKIYVWAPPELISRATFYVKGERNYNLQPDLQSGINQITPTEASRNQIHNCGPTVPQHDAVQHTTRIGPIVPQHDGVLHTPTTKNGPTAKQKAQKNDKQNSKMLKEFAECCNPVVTPWLRLLWYKHMYLLRWKEWNDRSYLQITTLY